MKGGEQISRSNQGGNTIIGINKAGEELKDQAVVVHRSTDIQSLIRKRLQTLTISRYI